MAQIYRATKIGAAQVYRAASASGSAIITGVTVTPNALTAAGGASGTLSAVVNGSGSPPQSVNWTITAGTIDPSTGAYALPAAIGIVQTVTATATASDGTHAGTCVFTIAASAAPAYATYILETFESVTGALRANLVGMRWYVWAQVAPTPLGAPIAQGVSETTDGAGVSLIDISGQTSVAPGAIVTLGFTNSNGDPAQADLMSWFGAVVAH